MKNDIQQLSGSLHKPHSPIVCDNFSNIFVQNVCFVLPCITSIDLYPNTVCDINLVTRICDVNHIMKFMLKYVTVTYVENNSKLWIQSSAVITRSNFVRYFINNYRTWCRISIRCWIHKRHTIPRPNGRAMGCLLWIFVRKLTAL